MLISPGEIVGAPIGVSADSNAALTSPVLV